MLTLALVGLSAVASFAQGTIQFLNSGLSPVLLRPTIGGTPAPAPLGTVMGVFWGTSADALSLQTPTTAIATTPGVFSGGTAYGLPGTAPGQTVFLKLAGWYNANGATPAEARQGTATPGITHYGEGRVVQTTALGPTTGPGTVVWQGAAGTNPNRVNAFVIEVVPEPSVVALGALGLGALLLIRRRKA